MLEQGRHASVSARRRGASRARDDAAGHHGRGAARAGTLAKQTRVSRRRRSVHRRPRRGRHPPETRLEPAEHSPVRVRSAHQFHGFGPLAGAVTGWTDARLSPRPDTFAGPGDIYVKLLPDGEPVQLTHDGSRSLPRCFRRTVRPSPIRPAPRGARTRGRSRCSAVATPLTGQRVGADVVGKGDRRVMFSEVEQGLYMKVATSSEGRAEERDVYRPPATGIGMAHRSASPQYGLSVIVVEMNQGQWLPCRVVPFDGGSAGRQVGPSPAKCTHAAWSPDGAWVYSLRTSALGSICGGNGFPTARPSR